MKKLLWAILCLAAVYWSVGFVLSPLGPRLQFDEIYTHFFHIDPKNDELNNTTTSDGENLWIGNYCFLHGENPLPVLLRETTPPDGIHPAVKDNTPYFPWSYVVGNLFVPGFLPLHAALWWELIITLALFVWMGIAVYKTDIKHHAAPFAALVTALCFAQYGYLPNLTFLNPSLFVIPLIVLGALYGAPHKPDKYNIISGCLLGIALIKPQMTALFLIPFLVRRQIAPLIIGALWVIAPWFFASWRYGENPLTLLADHLSTTFPIGFKANVYMGILNPLLRICENPAMINLMQMACFTLLVTFLCWRFRKAQNIVVFAIPAVASTLWTYSTATNIPVLAILIIAAGMVFLKSENKMEKAGLVLGVAFLLLPIAEVFRANYSPVILPIVQRGVYVALLTLMLMIEKRTLRAYPH
jgi:hypothetical protein